ncbi:hypothetical protein AB0C27_19030 [Nonomuraea sp. NPDC048882]|uniref:hypothetical protein n=1 Tax=Nonomuraea sp. NPDC048882 TaxID=3154347 RepID=UPI0033C36A79
MAEEEARASGRCFACKRTFSAAPETVETVLIDPETGLPPGFTVLGTFRPAGPDAVARSADQPICPDCLEKAAEFWKSYNAPPPTWPSWPPPTD